MEMKDLVGRDVKISPNSITAKNSDGKTCGVVRNARSFRNMPLREQVEWNDKIRRARRKTEVETCVSIHDCIIKDGEMYFLYSTKSTEIEKIVNPESYAKKMAEIQGAMVLGIIVIPVTEMKR